MVKIILFGAGYWGEAALIYFGAENVSCFCDNKVKGEEEGELNGKKVISFQKLLEICQGHVVVVCAGSNYTSEICEQLEKAGIEDYFDYNVLVAVGQSVKALMEELQSEHGRDKAFRRYYKVLAQRTKGRFEYLKRHTDITALKPAVGALRRKQLELLDLTNEFLRFIEELEIRPFLTFGNLIGAFRHKGFIPWDDDMDFALFRRDLEKLLHFAEENGVVGTRCGTADCEVWINTAGEKHLWSEMPNLYPDQYIFDIRSDMVQIYKSAHSCEQPILDIWVYDFYIDGYDMAEHRKWLEKAAGELREMEDEKDKVAYLRKMRQANPMISMASTVNVFPGIDNLGGRPGRRDVMEWIPAHVVFPLKKVIYENTEFWAPNDMEALLRVEYQDYMSLPYDLGDPRHSEAER